MSRITKDPLLTVAKGMLWFLMAAMAIGAAACTVAIPVVVFNQGKVAAELAKEGLSVVPGDFVGALLLLLASAAIFTALLLWMFRLLKRIVDTVGEGDPFVPENASRLIRMAWISLAVQVVAIPLAGAAMWIGTVTEGAADGEIGADGGFDFNGLLLMLILFILARVFRKGAEMRAELEGTV